MKVTLKHDIAIEEGYAYLDVEILKNAEDIAKFLENPDSYKDLKKEINEYLKNNKILDENLEHTELAKEISKTKKKYERECGKYEIEFISNDKIFNNRILRIKRCSSKESNTSPKTIKINNKEFMVLNYKAGQELCKIKLLKQSINMEKKDSNKKLEYKRVYYKTKIDTKNYEELKIDKEHFKNETEFLLQQNNFIKLYEKELGDDWDKEKETLKVSFDEIQEFKKKGNIKNNDIRTMIFNNNINGFEFEDIPLTPKTQEDLEKILTECILKDLEERHLTKEDLENKLRDYKEKNMDKELQELNIESKIRTDRKKYPVAFWHYHATNDLCPNDETL